MSPALSGTSPGTLPTGALIAHMSGADVFGLVVTVLIIGYLFYALIRGEKL
jgi:K+-transporting ATPase KdpF subunit